MQTMVHTRDARTQQPQAQQPVTITKLSEHVGAEVRGVDLSRPVDAATQSRLLAALHEHIALVIRDQSFTPDQFVGAGRVFGEVMPQDQPEIYCLPEQQLIRLVSNQLHKDKTGKSVHLRPAGWHTDHTNHECPPKYTTLYPISLPTDRVGGGTSICNMRAAYAALPEELKRRLESMKTVNVLVGSAARNANALSMEKERQKKSTEILHPLVRSNPDHGGSKSLYFHPKRTERIEGMTPEATQDLLADLIAKTVRPEFSYVHPWEMGDMLIWDNRSSLHRAGRDIDHSEHRLFHRLIIRGERPH